MHKFEKRGRVSFMLTRLKPTRIWLANVLNKLVVTHFGKVSQKGESMLDGTGHQEVWRATALAVKQNSSHKQFSHLWQNLARCGYQPNVLYPPCLPIRADKFVFFSVFLPCCEVFLELQPLLYAATYSCSHWICHFEFYHKFTWAVLLSLCSF